MSEDSEHYFDASSEPNVMEVETPIDYVDFFESQSDVSGAEEVSEGVVENNRIEEPPPCLDKVNVNREPSLCVDEANDKGSEEPNMSVDQNNVDKLKGPSHLGRTDFNLSEEPSVCLNNIDENKNKEQLLLISQSLENKSEELSVLVDKIVLGQIDVDKADISNKKYKINNDMFWDIEYPNNDKNLTEFEIYASKCEDDNFFRMNNNCDTYCSTPTDTDISDEVHNLNSEVELNFSYQKAPQGIIINSNVYLTDNQWNTLVFVDLKTVQCAVCDMYSDLDTSLDHIASDNHKENLDVHKPLDRFDLSITRKIENKYHCAVCNELFDLENERNHYTSKSHEGSLLFAVNKVFDIMYDYDINTESKKSNDCYHFNAKTIKNNNTKDDSTEEIESNEDFYVDYDYKAYDENDIAKDYYHYENENYDVLNIGTSYATMAKKPIGKAKPKILVKDLGNKKIQISYDSWHMIIQTKVNQFYCMVCKEHGHIRFKAKHSENKEHLDQLNSCKVIDTYEDHFIRQVDDKLYHCSHCNNLQLIHDMVHHLKTTHPSKTRKLSESSSVQNSIKSDNLDDKISLITNIESNFPNFIATTKNDLEFDDTTKEKSGPKLNMSGKDSYSILKDNNNNSASEIHTSNNIAAVIQSNTKIPSINIYEDIVLYPFGYKLKVPFLNYNVVCKKINDFYCGLCNTPCPENDLVNHVYNLQHIELLQRAPFMMVFGYHLIRSIREMFHCTLCNMPMPPEYVNAHNMQEIHIELLRKALGIIPNFTIITPKETKITHNVSRLASNSDTIKSGEKKTTLEFTTTLTMVKTTKAADHAVVVDKETKICDEDEDFNEIDKALRNCDKEKVGIVNESFESEPDPFDIEEHIYIKLKTKYIKITNSSYNTLVCVGDGSRYCFVCTCRVEFHELNKHVESRTHFENIEKYKFLDKYEEHLLRQFYLMYHCGICNVLVSGKQLKHHLTWPTHTLQNEYVYKNMKKQRRNDLKSGMREIIGLTQKEDIYLKGNEAKIKIIFNVQIANKERKISKVEKKNKIIIYNDVVLKVKWDHWHGIYDTKNGYKCRLCQKEMAKEELWRHVMGQWHSIALGIPLETQYSTALIRKINDSTLHCVICNIEISNNEHMVEEHIGGKKHSKNYESILEETSVTDSYADCSDDVLTI